MSRTRSAYLDESQHPREAEQSQESDVAQDGRADDFELLVDAFANDERAHLERNVTHRQQHHGEIQLVPVRTPVVAEAQTQNLTGKW